MKFDAVLRQFKEGTVVNVFNLTTEASKIDQRNDINYSEFLEGVYPYVLVSSNKFYCMISVGSGLMDGIHFSTDKRPQQRLLLAIVVVVLFCTTRID